MKLNYEWDLKIVTIDRVAEPAPALACNDGGKFNFYYCSLLSFTQSRNTMTEFLPELLQSHHLECALLSTRFPPV